MLNVLFVIMIRQNYSIILNLFLFIYSPNINASVQHVYYGLCSSYNSLGLL